MKIYIAADHRGFELKKKLIYALRQENLETDDLGAHEMLPLDDYVDYAKLVGEKVSQDADSRGILLCANGVGISIAVNKVRGIRSALGFSAKQIQTARHDDDINVLALPSEYLTEKDALEITKAFLDTTFADEEKYKRRIEKIREMEQA